MIQIDDANYGGLVGTCLIGAVRAEDISTFQTIALPIEVFQGDAYARREYMEAAAEAAHRLLTQLKASHDEIIHLCQGWVFNRTPGILKKAGYRHIHRGKIGEPMQSLIEKASADYLSSLGVNGITPGMPFGFHFYKCLLWLKGGNINGKALPERERFAKTGWPSYRIWATLPLQPAKIESKRLRRARHRPPWERDEGF